MKKKKKKKRHGTNSRGKSVRECLKIRKATRQEAAFQTNKHTFPLSLIIAAEVEPVGRVHAPYDTVNISIALTLTLPASRHLPARLLLPINPKGAVCGADPPVKVPWSNSRCEHPPSLPLSPTLSSLPLPPPVNPLPPPCSYEFSISFFGEKISNRGREEDISPMPTGECIWPSVYVCFIKAMKQSTQRKQQRVYTVYTFRHTHMHTQMCTRSP